MSDLNQTKPNVATTPPAKEWKWPLGIFLFYMTFVISTLGFVFFTFTQETDLVTQNYYEVTLTWQEQITKAENALRLEDPLRFKTNGKEVAVIIPENMRTASLTGNIHLYRPSGSGMDEHFSLSPDREGAHMISFADRASGLWTLKVSWEHENIPYYKEESIFIR
ncbi:MAG: FixH family protein [Balneolales bacterium]|nr:FixH family protein [Balneolales bacterium]